MPDLSKRPERYATVLVAALIAGSFAYSALGVRFGADPRVAELQAQNKQLQDKAKSASDQAAETSAAAASASAQPSTPSAITISQKNCAAFGTQEAAQAFWVKHKTQYASWDGNHNGVACEQLKSGAKSSASTEPKTSYLAAGASSGAASVHTEIRTVHDIQTIIKNEPAAPPAENAPAPPTKPTAPSKATILATKHMFGLDTATPDEAASVESSLARTPQIQGYFQGWDSDFRPNNVNAAWAAGRLPFLTWESRQLSSATDDYYPLADIAAGANDAYIRQYADAIVANGLPLMIRFDQEMNGNWYRWGETNTAADNPEGSYIAAWQHIHDIFQAEGANQLVIWDWSPNRTDNIGNLPSIDRYYPGPDYVDVAGMTGYYRYGNKTATFAATYNATLSELRRVAPGKPIMLSEVGATEGGGNKVNFINSFFAGLNENPDIIGFAWFNYTVTSTVNGVVTSNDWRINSSDGALTAFRTGLYSAEWGLPMGKHTVWGPASWSAPPAPTPTPTPASSSPAAASVASSTTSPSPTATKSASPTSTVKPKANAVSSPAASPTKSAAPMAATASRSASPSASPSV